MIALVNHNRRLLIAALVTLAVAITFWSGSRYPSLDEKATMAGDIKLEALGFDTIIEIGADDSFVMRAFATTVNWIDTNKQGMAFGLILAACLMTILSLLKRRSFENVFANSALGAVIGAPIGVCVNCVAPIARGMHSAGTRLETTLATMIASPTLNVIVLTMVISLLPWYLALTKIGLTLVVILFLIPLLSYIGARRGLSVALGPPPDVPGANALPWNISDDSAIGSDDSWRDAVKWTFVTFLRNLWYIIKIAVPLMLAAGIFGAVVVTALPWDALSDALPYPTGAKAFVVMAGIAIFGILLPVPIAFDIVVVIILIAAGVPIPYAMVLLFTLGIFSIYSFSIIWTGISKAVAVIMLAMLALIGLVAGYLAMGLENWDRASQRDVIVQTLGQPAPKVAAKVQVSTGVPAATMMSRLAPGRIAFQPVAADAPPNIAIAKADFGPRNGTAGAGDTLFTREDGATLGIDDDVGFALLKVHMPFEYGRGVAAGDVHNDGWPDLLVAEDTTVRGLALYANDGGQEFVRQAIEIPRLAGLDIVNAALVDLDDDGWLDIVFSANREGHHVIYNDNGEFPPRNMRELPRGKEAVAAAMAFGDLDRDGDLDIALGSWTTGLYFHPHPWSRNFILRQDSGGGFVREDLDEPHGETLSASTADFNNDGYPDLIFANDFLSAPDIFYTGGPDGQLAPITRESGRIKESTAQTMSIATADLDNDLVAETFLAQVAPGTGAGFSARMIPSTEICEELADAAQRRLCVNERESIGQLMRSTRRQDVYTCAKLRLEDPAARYECVVLHGMEKARRERDGTLCELLPPDQVGLQYMCRARQTKRVRIAPEMKAQAIPQIDKRNVLLVERGDGGFKDGAVAAGLDVTGWTWNAKFADLDNDGLKDLYAANGQFRAREFESNFFFHNEGGLKFAERTNEFGLADYHPTSAYSYVDFDNDGDLDIISFPTTGPVRVFRNNTTDANAIAVSLRDRIGNRFGIGSKIVVRSGGTEPMQQVIEIQSGGGFLSFDPPVAHFGLGTADGVDEIEVQWSTGENSRIKGPFDAGAHYVVTRSETTATAAPTMAPASLARTATAP